MATRNTARNENSQVDADAMVERERQAALISKWQKRIQASKEHFSDVFKRMRADQDWVYYGADPHWFREGGYVVNILKRELRQSVVGLYARNPTAVAERRTRLNTSIWQGDMAELESAFQVIMSHQSGLPVANEVLIRSTQIIQEAEQVRKDLFLRDRFAKTIELLFSYFVDECEPSFKRQFKGTVYRAKVNTVAFVKLDFQRRFDVRPEDSSELRDHSSLLAELQVRLNSQDHERGEDLQSRIAETQGMIDSIRKRQEVILREGPVFDFPGSDKVIVDPKVKSLEGFLGANWIAHEMDMNRDAILRQYGVDIKEHRTYGVEAYDNGDDDDCEERDVKVWEVQDKLTQSVFVICENCEVFLRAPEPPRVKLERFWTVFPLIFGFNEHYKHVYPLSDANDMRDTQNEYNVSRAGLADHRRQNKPKYLTRKGALSDENVRRALIHHDSGEIIEINISDPNGKPEDFLTAFKPYSIDPNQYHTSHVLDDFSLLGTKQEANLGLLSGATATESTIAETSRISGQSSEVDDIDDFLAEIAKAAGQLMLAELSAQTVKKIVGPGAVWPEQSDTAIYEGVELSIRAGSAGRPNQAMTISKLERAMPFLSQIPGVSPTPLARKYAEALDIDTEELVIEGLPSINALNQSARNAAPGAAPTSNVPSQQGPQGADNDPAPPDAPSQTDNVTPFPGDRT